MPDYGKIHTYRSPAGFGIRLDGASAYGGAVISPFYDSLLVKVTAWGSDFPQACQRMDRALREFRIRGVKTNIPFLENVVNHPAFQAGETTTDFLDETPELFQFTARRDRATKLLTYLARRDRERKSGSGGQAATRDHSRATRSHSRSDSRPPRHAPVARQTGPEKICGMDASADALLLTDTTFRDAHQSLMATRVRTYDMLAIADYVLEATAATLQPGNVGRRDVRRRHAIPARRSVAAAAAASEAHSEHLFPDAAPRLERRRLHGLSRTTWCASSSRSGGAGHRYFPHLRFAELAAEHASGGGSGAGNGPICEAAICYTGDILDPKRDKYSLKYYVRLAKELEKMGTHILGIKDMAGLLRPYAAYKLVKALKEEVAFPIHLHTHDTSGINAASILKAAEAGVDVADGAMSSMSGATSQPNLNSIVAALAHTERDTGLDFDALNDCSDYWETVRDVLRPVRYRAEIRQRRSLPPRNARRPIHQSEGAGRSMGLGARWPEIARTYAEVNLAFGDIVKVTPSSKVVGDLAMFLVSHDMTVKDLENLPPDHHLTLPNSVIDMFMGSLGEPEGGWPEKIQRVVLRGEKPNQGRPGERLAPADLEKQVRR